MSSSLSCSAGLSPTIRIGGVHLIDNLLLTS